MIISLVSSVLGIAGGLIPDIFKEIKDSREHTREKERLHLEADLQLKLLAHKTDARLAEADANVVVEEMRAFGKQMQGIYSLQKQTNIKFVDGFNAILRPLTAFLIMLMFFGIAVTFSIGVINDLGTSNLQTVSQVLWGSMIGDSIQAVLGYLFGYRTTKGRIGQIRAQLK